MIKALGQHASLSGLFTHHERVYRMGPSFFRPGSESVARFLVATELDPLERSFLTDLIKLSLDLGGGAHNRWIGLSLSNATRDKEQVARRLAELGLVEIDIGVPDDNSHQLHEVVFPSRTLVASVVEALPASM